MMTLEGVKVMTQVRWWHQVVALNDVYAHGRRWWHWLVAPNHGTRAAANADCGGSLSWRHDEGSYLAWLPHHVIALVVFDGRPGANLSNYRSLILFWYPPKVEFWPLKCWQLRLLISWKLTEYIQQTRCSRGCSTITSVTHWFIHLFIDSSFSSNIF